ncbi:protocatechuate 3,4-dioxygenase subunit alpha [Streptomyces albus]|uniref:Protocatechuate 3,4-dioxygenase subunit alpha n=1 Tax=Streptomyces albus (strain ATCC 21838 / DSM 41398 / FERM P-419 / JCM 4703 / NBRC 107858) TaxID=1081613 RepID=A0A0B5EGG0_STRA4|nr:protocatechuate 3,4-dioxygenase subunit alpha [Streptomyces albus]AOU74724.1 protocatechuate 3,4-dioxygenase subunit alpha [Streptomyces albus]AYN30535.1 protocatechuate 3,4-dioxygenase subunit alpha [Streptomyces albus]
MPLPPTPSQTIGPFYGFALPSPHGADLAPPGHPGALTLHGYLYDGTAAPIPDALVEVWQPAPDGSRGGAPGSLRQDPATGRGIARDSVRFTGFGRVATDADGHYTLRTLPPGGVPYLSLLVFARGLLHHLHTRAYLPGPPDPTADPLLASLEPRRRATLLATAEDPRTHRFDIRLQDDGVHEETVFLAFP